MRSEIIERLEKLTGPDREVDALVAVLSDWNGTAAAGGVDRPVVFSGTVVAYLPDRSARQWEAPAYTASLDAAIALVERMLPAWDWQVRMTGYVELHHPTHHLKDEVAHGATPAIALLLALFRALEVSDAE